MGLNQQLSRKPAALFHTTNQWLSSDLQTAFSRILPDREPMLKRALSWLRWLFTPMPPRPCKVCGREEPCDDCNWHWRIR
jgi:hypothetical protein